MSNSNAKEIIKIGLILFAITAISAMLLAIVNKATAPVIAKNQLKKTYASMQTVMPDADNFEPIEITGFKNISEGYSALDKNGEKIGVCLITTANGYGGEIKVLTGISDGKVTGIDILSHSETPGLGAKSVEPEFKNQFAGKGENIKVSKSSAKDNEINAISGATITSNAVTAAVNTALKFSAEVDK